MSKWSIFFACITAVIVTTMFIPQVFGFLNFTQWGGMYTDGWCRVTVISRNVPLDDKLPPGTKRMELLAGKDPPIRAVWFAPMHNTDTCVAWAHSWCWEKAPKEDWTILAAYPYIRQEWVLGGVSACHLSPDDESLFLFKR